MSTQTPNAAQIRAALGLLKWENETLAKACGVTPQSISNIKRGVTRPQPRILSSIRNVFEKHGVEFLENSGVRLKAEGVEILQGTDGFRKFYDLIYDRVSHDGGIICVSGVDENLFAKYQKGFGENHMERMTKLVRARKDIRMRILVREGDTNLIATSYATYRWQNPESFSPTAFYVFGDYLGLISFEGENAPKVILIHSAIFAEAYRRQFSAHWRSAVTPPKIK